MSSPQRRISPDSPRKKIKDKRRLQLIDANMESIARHGLSETTISHISEAAGMSRGIINFYFKSKEEMMRETLSQLMQEQGQAWRDAIDRSAGRPALERLGEGVKAVFGARICTRKKLAVWSAFVAHAATHPNYRYIFEVETGRMRDEILTLAALADSEIDAAGFANGLISYVRGLRLELLIGDTGRGRVELEKEALAFLQHLSPQPKKTAPMKTNPEATVEKKEKTKKARPAEIEALPIADLFSL